MSTVYFVVDVVRSEKLVIGKKDKNSPGFLGPVTAASVLAAMPHADREVVELWFAARSPSRFEVRDDDKDRDDGSGYDDWPLTDAWLCDSACDRMQALLSAASPGLQIRVEAPDEYSKAFWVYSGDGTCAAGRIALRRRPSAWAGPACSPRPARRNTKLSASRVSGWVSNP